MRYFFATLLAGFVCFNASAQNNPEVAARQANLEGKYRSVSKNHGCDSVVTKLQLECTPSTKCSWGRYTLTKTNYYADGFCERASERCGEWFVMKTCEGAEKEDVLVIVLDMLGRYEKYPLFLVQKDGSLFELNRKSPERFPTTIVKKDGYLYINQKGGEAESLNKTMYYRGEFPIFHTFRKVK